MVWNKFDFPDLQETGSLPIETNTNLSAKNMFFLVFFGGPGKMLPDGCLGHREVEKSTVNFLSMSTTSFSVGRNSTTQRHVFGPWKQLECPRLLRQSIVFSWVFDVFAMSEIRGSQAILSDALGDFSLGPMSMPC